MDCEQDTLSVWSYDGEGLPDAFNLAGLHAIVDRYFGQECTLVRIAEGGFHKVRSPSIPDSHNLYNAPWQVYDIFEKGEDGQPGKSLQAVVRVASPAFPRDKLLSEVRRAVAHRLPIHLSKCLDSNSTLHIRPFICPSPASL